MIALENPIKAGTIFTRLKVIERTDEKKHNYYVYKCLCVPCNKIVYVRSDNLRNGEVRSCGCLHDELFQRNVRRAYEKNFKDGTSIPKIKSNELQRNNTSGVPGVSWHKKARKWQARIAFRGKTYCLGYYDDLEKAKEARELAKKEIHTNYLNSTSQ